MVSACAGLAQVLAQPAEHAAAPLLGSAAGRASARRGAVDDEQIPPVACHRAATIAASWGRAAAGRQSHPWRHGLAGARSGSRREITLETPSSLIDTPYSESAASIVRFWWVTTMNCARSE